jgi:DNA (cytosine-5)-methyltransferase 1
MNVIDLFCGADGLSLGFEEAGFNILTGVEIEPNFLKTYMDSHKKSIGILKDINQLKIKDFLSGRNIDHFNIDLVIGGPPCQGFSTAGNRMIDDPRNAL